MHYDNFLRKVEAAIQDLTSGEVDYSDLVDGYVQIAEEHAAGKTPRQVARKILRENDYPL
jgi:hypothetical protein